MSVYAGHLQLDHPVAAPHVETRPVPPAQQHRPPAGDGSARNPQTQQQSTLGLQHALGGPEIQHGLDAVQRLDDKMRRSTRTDPNY